MLAELAGQQSVALVTAATLMCSLRMACGIDHKMMTAERVCRRENVTQALAELQQQLLDRETQLQQAQLATKEAQTEAAEAVNRVRPRTYLMSKRSWLIGGCGNCRYRVSLGHT